MRVLLTGAGGFVGRWLTAELAAAGHEVIPAPPHRELDLAARPDLGPLISRTRPDAVAHLAGMAYGPDAVRDPEAAIAVNAGGTAAVLAGLDAAGSASPALIVTSSDVYGSPATLPVPESAPVRPKDAYGRSKAAEERVALEAHARGRALVIARSFNHTGPGQRAEFAAPALASRVLAVKLGDASEIRAGNLESRRDFTDVRDVVRAYRLLLERLVGPDGLGVEPPVVNVGSGRSVAIREVLETLCRMAGVAPQVRVDPSLLRPDDVADVYADVSLLRQLTGWEPRIPLEQTLADLLASIQG